METTMNKTLAILTALLMVQPAAHAAPSDSERIAELEYRVNVLTEQVNRLLAERHGRRSDDGQAVYVCRLKAFTQTYRAENTNRGRARLDVIRQCRAAHNEMFCKDEDVSCETYR